MALVSLLPQLHRSNSIITLWPYIIFSGWYAGTELTPDEIVADGLTKEMRCYVRTMTACAEKMGLTGVQADGHWRKHPIQSLLHW